VNPPVIFEAVIKIMKTFTKAKIMERMDIATMKDLPKYASKKMLPQRFGGKLALSPEDTFKLFKEFAAANEDRLRK